MLVALLTYSLHGAESLVLQLVKKFPAFYGTRKFITVPTSARHLSVGSITVMLKLCYSIHYVQDFC